MVILSAYERSGPTTVRYAIAEVSVGRADTLQDTLQVRTFTV